MRIGLVEFLLILAIASLTVGPQAALFVDRWMRRANRANARAARRRAEYAAQMAAERDALLKRFRTASTVFGVGILLALVYALVFRPIDTPPQSYAAPEVRRSTGAVQTALSADSRDVLALRDYQGVDCIREQDGFVYAAAYNGATLKKRKSDLVRTDGGSFSAILSVDGELTGFAFDADGDLWLTVLTPGGGALCRARHDSWGAAVEQVVTQIDGAPLGAVSAVETGPDGKVYFAVAGGEALGRHIRLGLPRRRIRRRHILHRELERTYQFRPRLAEPANLGRHHIVEHAGASAVTGQTGAEHRGSCAATVAVAVDSCVPRWLKHGSHHRAWRRQHALGLVHWL